MISLNKLIIAGTFILLILFMFHSNIKEGFVQENDGINDIFANEYSDLQRKRSNGSSNLTKNLLHTVSSHLKNMHIEKTVDLIRKNSYVGNADGTDGKIDFSPLNDSQVKQLNHIEHINKLNHAVQQSINFHDSMPTHNNLLKAMFGN